MILLMFNILSCNKFFIFWIVGLNQHLRASIFFRSKTNPPLETTGFMVCSPESEHTYEAGMFLVVEKVLCGWYDKEEKWICKVQSNQSMVSTDERR